MLDLNFQTGSINSPDINIKLFDTKFFHISPSHNMETKFKNFHNRIHVCHDVHIMGEVSLSMLFLTKANGTVQKFQHGQNTSVILLLLLSLLFYCKSCLKQNVSNVTLKICSWKTKIDLIQNLKIHSLNADYFKLWQ